MCSVLVIIGGVGAEDPLQMPLVEYDDVPKALAFDGPDYAFGVRIGLRRQLHPMVPVHRNFFRSRIPSIHCKDASLRW